MNISYITEIFDREFAPIKDRFRYICLTVEEAPDSNTEFVWHPGVYVWFHPDKGVIRVGRSLTNSRKRALEHIVANTGGVVADISKDKDTRILLFNVIDPSNIHWITALEVYFERQLAPAVKARLG